MKDNIIVTEIPFNKFVGLEKAEESSNCIFILKEKQEFHNHLGTLHASVLFALAEATSGEFLLRQFDQIQMDVMPVVRRAEIKYSRQGSGKAYSRAEFAAIGLFEAISELKNKKKAMITVKVEIFDQESEKLLIAFFDWFISVRRM